MVINQLNIVSILAFEAENDPPIGVVVTDIKVIQLVPTPVYPVGVVVEIKPAGADIHEEYVVEFRPDWRETFLAVQLQLVD